MTWEELHNVNNLNDIEMTEEQEIFLSLAILFTKEENYDFSTGIILGLCSCDLDKAEEIMQQIDDITYLAEILSYSIKEKDAIKLIIALSNKEQKC